MSAAGSNTIASSARRSSTAVQTTLLESRRGALVLRRERRLPVVGCSSVIGHEQSTFEFRLSRPDGAGFRATWEGVIEQDDVEIGLAATLTHTGSGPCPVAVYLHATEPDRADMPTLTGLPAPESPGELIFEAILLPPRDGVVFTTEIGELDFDLREALHPVPPEPPTTRSWLTIATCAEPDIRVDMRLNLGFSRPQLPGRADRPSDLSAVVLWR
jgi:hypothetical protein